MAAVTQAWSSAWNGDAGVRVSCPVRPVQAVNDAYATPFNDAFTRRGW